MAKTMDATDWPISAKAARWLAAIILTVIGTGLLVAEFMPRRTVARAAAPTFDLSEAKLQTYVQVARSCEDQLVQSGGAAYGVILQSRWDRDRLQYAVLTEGRTHSAALFDADFQYDDMVQDGCDTILFRVSANERRLEILVLPNLAANLAPPPTKFTAPNPVRIMASAAKLQESIEGALREGKFSELRVAGRAR